MAYLTAGTKFYINDTVINKGLSTPDIGATPDNVDITSFDSLVNYEYLPGLQNVSNLEFTFLQEIDNFNSALSTANTENTSYKVEFPSGLKSTFTGSHVVVPLAAQPNQPEKFKISISVSGSIDHSTT